MICIIVKVCMMYRGISDYLGDELGKVYRGCSIWVSLKNEVYWEFRIVCRLEGIYRVKIMIKNLGGKK